MSAEVTLTDALGAPIVSGSEQDVYEATFTERVMELHPYWVEYANGRTERFRFWMPASIVKRASVL